MTTLAEAFVKVRPDVSKFGTELKTQTTKASGDAGTSSGKSFASGLLKATAVLGAAGIAVGFFKGALGEAKESLQVGAQTDAVLKSTGNAAGITATQVGALATAISNKTGVDDEAIQSNENLLLTFTNLRNGVGAGNDIFNQATLAVSDMSAALGQDGKSSAIQLGKALNDPIKGVKALSRVGVSFTQQQKDQIKTLVESGDTLGAQKIILGEVKKEFGGSAAAIATPGEKMKVAWGNLQETIGLKLIPVLNKLLPILGTVIGFVSDHATAFGILATAIVAIVGAIKIWNIVQAILNAELFANPIGLIVLGIAALVAIIVVVATKTQFFQTVWHAVWGGITAVAQAAWNGVIKPIFNLWVAEIKIVAAILLWLWHHIVQPVIAGIVAEFHFLLGIVKGVGRFFSVDLPNLFGKGVKFISDKVTGLVNFFRGVPGKITSATKGMFNGIKDAFRAAVNFIIRGWNNLHFSIPGVNTHIPGVGTIGGFTLSTPNIPELASGGIVKARAGGRVVRVGEGGQDEAIVPLSKLGAMAPTIHVYLGTREIQDIIDIRVDESDRDKQRLAGAGAGARSATVRRNR